MSKNIVQLNDSNFESTTSKGVTLVDFYADWCGPCKMIAPLIEELSSEYVGKATVAKLDIEQSQDTTSKLQVTSIPTIILFKDGKEMERVVGVRGKGELQKMLSKAL